MSSVDTLKQAAQALRRAKDAHEFAEMKQPGYGHAEDAKLCAELAAALEALAAQEPAAWISTVMCIGPEYGKERYGKLPIQSLQPGYYKHTPLYTAPIATPEHEAQAQDALRYRWLRDHAVIEFNARNGNALRWVAAHYSAESPVLDRNIDIAIKSTGGNHE